ncbi:NADH-quinone oxidoreductase subunit H [Candidatus Fokinia solitaria]|uniref:NADH-quinone oxidoreductase subunit H n=1 Tax=Candidatus Fokinia solitaria TaxID=1802984 RepID=A0A2U8BR87_9RICK|nr:NADH-quinone oxidoreductase subunit NuoH [Candidatus Fokinia solitaria]AWD32856.1 NADH-quinone oxidoreductase subunit H [Candidatus Fokinia solitaria]
MSIIISSIILLLCVLLTTAYLTLIERKLIGFIQLRVGPSMVGVFGILQPVADTIKLLFKEPIIPHKADKILFLTAPLLMMVIALFAWVAIPIGDFCISNLNLGILFVLSVSSLSVYSIILAGLASNSKYPFLAAIRATAQMISYELTMGLCILSVVVVAGSGNLIDIVYMQTDISWLLRLLMYPVGVLFFICALAETNRHPFDLAEAESELVAGYHSEYSSMQFAMFFLGEYANMALMSSLTTLLFLGGWLPPFDIQFLECVPSVVWFLVKTLSCLMLFIIVRAVLPRYRYDQLLRIGWERLLPISFILFMLITATKYYLTH